jgi:hypothetical protein
MLTIAAVDSRAIPRLYVSERHATSPTIGMLSLAAVFATE